MQIWVHSSFSSILKTPVYVCGCTHTCMCTCVCYASICVCVHMCKCIQRPQDNSSTLFLTPNRLSCLGSELQGSSCLCTPNAGVTSTCHHAQLFCKGSGNRTQLLMLNWVTSPGHVHSSSVSLSPILFLLSLLFCFSSLIVFQESSTLNAGSCSPHSIHLDTTVTWETQTSHPHATQAFPGPGSFGAQSSPCVFNVLPEA